MSALATCFLAFAITSFSVHLFSSRALKHTTQNRHLFLLIPRVLRFSSAAADSFAEEIGSRAYVIERFTMLTGKFWVGGCLSVAASLFMHIYIWGVHGAMERLPSLLLLTALYMWRRNLGASVLAHFLIDAELSLVLMLPKSIIHQIAFLLGLGHKAHTG
jgi:membrane protease YdiL (CAAX protease family)